MLIYNILAEGSLAGAGKPVTFPVYQAGNTSDKELSGGKFCINWEAPLILRIY